MLIKVITLGGDTHIIEDVTDVSVLKAPRVYDGRETPESAINAIFERTSTFFFDHLGQRSHSTSDDKYNCRVIEYAKDGPCRLYVANKAYICNNEGRTIEKVVAGPETV